jgi:hypothetical protein
MPSSTLGHDPFIYSSQPFDQPLPVYRADIVAAITGKASTPAI